MVLEGMMYTSWILVQAFQQYQDFASEISMATMVAL
jgi:hypothetical protein